MSFTGFKSLVLFSYLLEAPRSYDEICEYFLAHPYLREKISIDTLRVYITSLKRVGCSVKRERVNGVSRYSIISNPFELTVSPDQLASLIKVYKIISKDLTVEELLDIELFMNKLANKIKNPEIIQAFSKVSLLKGIDIEILKELILITAKNQQIVILYKSPRSGTKPVEVITSGLKIENGKIYLCGYSLKYKQDATYILNRIAKIQEIKLRKTEVQKNIQIVGVEYFGDISNLELEDNEKIVSQKSTSVVIEISSSNEFSIVQRVLSFTDNAKILYPESFKRNFIEKLKKMKAGYYIG